MLWVCVRGIRCHIFKKGKLVDASLLGVTVTARVRLLGISRATVAVVIMIYEVGRETLLTKHMRDEKPIEACHHPIASTPMVSIPSVLKRIVT